MPLSNSAEALSDFKPYPWYNALLAAPHIDLEPTHSRNPPYPNPQAHTLFSSTLFNPTGLRAMQTFHARASTTAGPSVLPSPTSQSTDGRSNSYTSDRSLGKPLKDTPSDEWLVVVSLGTGLNGIGGIVHGGLAMTLLDDAMAVCAFRAAGQKPILTTRYEADFKRKIKAPCVILCRAWLDERAIDVKKEGSDGEKGKEEDRETICTRSRLEDGMGNVYLEVAARFAKRRERAKAKL